MWIADAEMLIEARRLKIDADLVIDEAKLDYVIREAVRAHVLHPDDATQVTTSVDDASATRTYKSSRGRVSILDEWWLLLGLTTAGSGAFSVTPARSTTGTHSPICALYFGATYCSCGADLTNYAYPLYEGGVIW